MSLGHLLCEALRRRGSTSTEHESWMVADTSSPNGGWSWSCGTTVRPTAAITGRTRQHECRRRFQWLATLPPVAALPEVKELDRFEQACSQLDVLWSIGV